MLDSQSTSPELTPPPALALLPIGSLEQHGPHLPIGCDIFWAAEMGREIARQLGAWLLPTQPYSCAQEHQNLPGTVTLRPSTLVVLLDDIVESLARQGVQRLVVLNFHGGNWVLHSAIRDLNRRQDRVTAILCQPYEGAPGLDFREDLHAGDFETSLALFKIPKQVKTGAVDCVPEVSPALLDQVGIEELSPHGVWGRATRASAERGKSDWAWMVANAVRNIREALMRVGAYAEKSRK